MRRRLYVVLPDLASARQTARDLQQAGVPYRRMHFLGPRGMPLEDLHEAGPLLKSDVKHALAVGAYLGLLCGLMLGLYLQSVPIGAYRFGAGTAVLATLGGAAFGAWCASLVGVSAPNWKLRCFDAEFAAGRILLVLDVEPSRTAGIHDLLARTHPEAVERRLDVRLPAFP